MLKPGKSSAQGQHWVYRLEGHRKCWFETAEATASVTKRVHHRAAAQPMVASEENAAALRKRKAIVDARAQLPRSAPADAVQPTLPGPDLKVVDAAPVRAVDAAASLVPPIPAIDVPTMDQLTPDEPMPRQVNVEMLLAAAPSAVDTVVSSVPPAAPGALGNGDADEDERGWAATHAGVLLMTLGLISFVGSLLIGRFLNWRGDATRRTSSVLSEAHEAPRANLVVFAYAPNRPEASSVLPLFAADESDLEPVEARSV